MDVMEWEGEEDPVVDGPLPCLDQRLDLGFDVGVGDDHPFGPSGGAAGEEDHGPARGFDPGERHGLGIHLVVEEELDLPRLGQGAEDLGEPGR
jgi:hypothetical protein